ncbi:alkyl sulfatase dimerization domain-containing protein [Streptomyces spectabilis]|uniref:alkyl sulfatase dimerization domain-containing protein n=1 Tax=Streptomyces spectabilis TaxID=68270 RepID=UPI0033E3889A
MSRACPSWRRRASWQSSYVIPWRPGLYQLKPMGVQLIFQLTPGTEALAEMNIYFPDARALCIAENAMHSILSLRGAQVRDAHAWSKYLTEAAKELQAKVFTQLGYGRENATWRNAYLTGAQEVVNGPQRGRSDGGRAAPHSDRARLGLRRRRDGSRDGRQVHHDAPQRRAGLRGGR